MSFTLRDLKHHDHLCWICDDQQDWQNVALPFLSFGLGRNERSIILGDKFPKPFMRQVLGLSDLNVPSLEASGHLLLVDNPAVIWAGQERRAKDLIEFLQAETEQALDQGLDGLRFICEIRWAFGSEPDPLVVAEYETLLAESLLPRHPCIGLCQYDRRSFGDLEFKGVIMSHPILIKDSKAFHNFVPMPGLTGTEEWAGELEEPEDEFPWPSDAGGLRHIHDSMRFLRSILDNSRQAFCAEFKGGRIMTCNPAFCALTGYETPELESLSWLDDLVAPEWRAGEQSVLEEMAMTGEPKTYTLRITRKDGCHVWVEVYRHQVLGEDGNLLYYCSFVNDITARKMEEEQLVFRAFHDPLTGLPNRSLFMDRLRQAMELARRSEEYHFAVVFLDLDDFKAVNDTYGHLAGDQVLSEIGHRLKEGLRNVDTLARLGGDEFAILLSDLKAEEDAGLVAGRIRNAMSRTLMAGRQEVQVSASVGIVSHVREYERPEQILRDADSAMYRSKALGRGRCTTFARRPRSTADILLVDDLRRALEREEFILLYQPIVSLKTSRVIGFEALLRWVHPLRGMIEPAEFLETAAAAGEAPAIAGWALYEACRQTRAWNARFPGISVSVSVNLSAESMSGEELVEQVEEVIVTSGLDPRLLKLEFQKRAFGGGESMAGTLMQLKELDIQLAIDDFTIGCPTLSHLQQYSIVPIDAVKIDRSVISRITFDDKQAESVWSISMIAQTLGIDVIAKGVETREQVDKLLSLKCEFGQGYYFSRPVLNHKAEAIISDQQTMIV